MSNTIKHKILKELHNVYNNNPDLPDDDLIGIISRSLSFDYLKEKLNVSESELDQNLKYLVLNGEVEELHKNSINKHLNFKLMETGCKSFYTRYYYNKVWFRDRKFLITIIPILISLIAIAVNYYVDNSATIKSIELENRILSIEKKLDKINKNIR